MMFLANRKLALGTLGGLLLALTVSAIVMAGTEPPRRDPANVSSDPPTTLRKPTGGPFATQAQASAEALRAASSHGGSGLVLSKVSLMTYRESARLNGHGESAEFAPGREIYVVYINGPVTNDRGPITLGPQTFERTYWLIDAPTGDTIGWGSRP